MPRYSQPSFTRAEFGPMSSNKSSIMNNKNNNNNTATTKRMNNNNDKTTTTTKRSLYQSPFGQWRRQRCNSSHSTALDVKLAASIPSDDDSSLNSMNSDNNSSDNTKSPNNSRIPLTLDILPEPSVKTAATETTTEFYMPPKKKARLDFVQVDRDLREQGELSIMMGSMIQSPFEDVMADTMASLEMTSEPIFLNHHDELEEQQQQEENPQDDAFVVEDDTEECFPSIHDKCETTKSINEKDQDDVGTNPSVQRQTEEAKLAAAATHTSMGAESVLDDANVDESFQDANLSESQSSFENNPLVPQSWVKTEHKSPKEYVESEKPHVLLTTSLMERHDRIQTEALIVGDGASCNDDKKKNSSTDVKRSENNNVPNSTNNTTTTMDKKEPVEESFASMEERNNDDDHSVSQSSIMKSTAFENNSTTSAKLPDESNHVDSAAQSMKDQDEEMEEALLPLAAMHQETTNKSDSGHQCNGTAPQVSMNETNPPSKSEKERDGIVSPRDQVIVDRLASSSTSTNKKHHDNVESSHNVKSSGSTTRCVTKREETIQRDDEGSSCSTAQTHHEESTENASNGGGNVDESVPFTPMERKEEPHDDDCSKTKTCSIVVPVGHSETNASNSPTSLSEEECVVATAVEDDDKPSSLTCNAASTMQTACAPKIVESDKEIKDHVHYSASLDSKKTTAAKDEDAIMNQSNDNKRLTSDTPNDIVTNVSKKTQGLQQGNAGKRLETTTNQTNGSTEKETIASSTGSSTKEMSVIEHIHQSTLAVLNGEEGDAGNRLETTTNQTDRSTEKETSALSAGSSTKEMSVEHIHQSTLALLNEEEGDAGNRLETTTNQTNQSTEMETSASSAGSSTEDMTVEHIHQSTLLNEEEGDAGNRLETTNQTSQSTEMEMSASSAGSSTKEMSVEHIHQSTLSLLNKEEEDAGNRLETTTNQTNQSTEETSASSAGSSTKDMTVEHIHQSTLALLNEEEVSINADSENAPNTPDDTDKDQRKLSNKEYETFEDVHVSSHNDKSSGSTRCVKKREETIQRNEGSSCSTPAYEGEPTKNASGGGENVDESVPSKSTERKEEPEENSSKNKTLPIIPACRSETKASNSPRSLSEECVATAVDADNPSSLTRDASSTMQACAPKSVESDKEIKDHVNAASLDSKTTTAKDGDAIMNQCNDKRLASEQQKDIVNNVSKTTDSTRSQGPKQGDAGNRLEATMNQPNGSTEKEAIASSAGSSTEDMTVEHIHQSTLALLSGEEVLPNVDSENAPTPADIPKGSIKGEDERKLANKEFESFEDTSHHIDETYSTQSQELQQGNASNRLETTTNQTNRSTEKETIASSAGSSTEEMSVDHIHQSTLALLNGEEVSMNVDSDNAPTPAGIPKGSIKDEDKCKLSNKQFGSFEATSDDIDPMYVSKSLDSDAEEAKDELNGIQVLPEKLEKTACHDDLQDASVDSSKENMSYEPWTDSTETNTLAAFQERDADPDNIGGASKRIVSPIEPQQPVPVPATIENGVGRPEAAPSAAPCGSVQQPNMLESELRSNTETISLIETLAKEDDKVGKEDEQHDHTPTACNQSLHERLTLDVSHEALINAIPKVSATAPGEIVVNDDYAIPRPLGPGSRVKYVDGSLRRSDAATTESAAAASHQPPVQAAMQAVALPTSGSPNESTVSLLTETASSAIGQAPRTNGKAIACTCSITSDSASRLRQRLIGFLPPFEALGKSSPIKSFTTGGAQYHVVDGYHIDAMVPAGYSHGWESDVGRKLQWEAQVLCLLHKHTCSHNGDGKWMPNQRFPTPWFLSIAKSATSNDQCFTMRMLTSLAIVGPVEVLGTLQTLLDLNRECSPDESLPISTIVFLLIEVLQIVSTIHKHGITNNDIGLDSFLVMRRKPAKAKNEKVSQDHEWFLQFTAFGASKILGVGQEQVTSKNRRKGTRSTRSQPAEPSIKVEHRCQAWHFKEDLRGVANVAFSLLTGGKSSISSSDVCNGWNSKLQDRIRDVDDASTWWDFFSATFSAPDASHGLHSIDWQLVQGRRHGRRRGEVHESWYDAEQAIGKLCRLAPGHHIDLNNLNRGTRDSYLDNLMSRGSRAHV